MRKLMNVLYVSSEGGYLSLDGENVVIIDGDKEIGRVPLHNLEEIVSFGYRGASPALMGACAERDISLCFMTPQGRFLARIIGKMNVKKVVFSDPAAELTGIQVAGEDSLSDLRPVFAVVEIGRAHV